MEILDIKITKGNASYIYIDLLISEQDLELYRIENKQIEGLRYYYVDCYVWIMSEYR